MTDDDKKYQRARERAEPEAQGQATQDIGNVAGQKASQQQGASGTLDQGGSYGRPRADAKAGVRPPDAKPEAPSEPRDKELQKR